jgi:hypothetical protein
LKDGDRVIIAELVNASAPSTTAAGAQRGSKGTGF